MAAFSAIDVQYQREWIAGVRAGQVDAFRALFEAYTPRLCRFAQVSVPADVAEDIVQDVLFDVWQRRDRLVVGNGELTQYLFGAVRNRVLQYARHQRVVQRVERQDDGAEPVGMGAPPDASDMAAIANDVTAALLESLDRLSELQRAVLSLRWTNGMTYEQVAGVLSISPQAARQHASRAQRILRPLLLRFLGE